MQLDDVAFPELAKLRELAHNLDKLDEFDATYTRIVEAVALDMIRVKNTDKLLDGLYRRKLSAARAVLMEQVAWLEAQEVDGNA